MPGTIMLPNNIKLMSKEVAPTFSTDIVAKIKKYCKTQTKDIFDHLSKSLAPNIHGREYIKKAILCMLLRGNEKVLNNGARIKGDINILLLGEQFEMPAPRCNTVAFEPRQYRWDLLSKNPLSKAFAQHLSCLTVYPNIAHTEPQKFKAVV